MNLKITIVGNYLEAAQSSLFNIKRIKIIIIFSCKK